MSLKSMPGWGSLIVWTLLAVLPSNADEFSDKGREIFKKNQAAVVTVKVVVKNKVSVTGMA